MRDTSSSSESEEEFPPELEEDISGDCKFCRKILYVVEKEVSTIKNHLSLDIGRIDELLSSECTRHKPLLERFSKDLKLEEKGTLSIFRDIFSSSFWFYASSESGHSESDFGRNTTGLDVQGSHGLGIQLNVSWIDEEGLSNWYTDCITHHGEKCSSPKYLQLLPRSEPEYFIDTELNCLVSAPANAPYVALSYVWGQIMMVNTTVLNLAQLRQPGAFQDPAIQEILPGTVRHAMYLTGKLKGLRYLWVDALCIVQDDEDMMYKHLPQMGSIYANADIVITSMDGNDANHGLHGLQDAPEPVPRHVEQSTIQFGDLALVERHSMGDRRSTSGTRSPYLNRGWTFQEHFFSRRCICFENNSVWFQCCRSTRYEDHKKPELPDRERDWILNVGYPSITVLSRLIGDFNKRQLTFPQDCLLAIAGIVPCYTRVFTGGFLSGLPEMFIDAMLLWQPGGDLVRRVPLYNVNKNSERPDKICLPSWSWAGWHGVLDFDGWSAANDFVASCSGWIHSGQYEIISTTSWYACNTPQGTNRRKINCLWTEWRERYKNPAEELPEGWTKRLKKEGERFTCEAPPNGYGEYVYHFKGSNNPTFWYPLPLDDPTAVPRTDTNVAYLCGQVQIAHAYTLGRVLTTEKRTGESTEKQPYISLGSIEGKWIGILRLHSVDYLEEKGIELGKEGYKVDLVAISEGYVPNDAEWGVSFVDEYEMEERPKEGQRYHFVNVLWVSWDGTVARREALGRVPKADWESLRPKTIDVVLG